METPSSLMKTLYEVDIKLVSKEASLLVLIFEMGRYNCNPDVGWVEPPLNCATPYAGSLCKGMKEGIFSPCLLVLTGKPIPSLTSEPASLGFYKEGQLRHPALWPNNYWILRPSIHSQPLLHWLHHSHSNKSPFYIERLILEVPFF